MRRVLVLEDDEDLRAVMCDMLRFSGTPLQTLEVGIQLLENEVGDRKATSARMLRALDELRAIHRMFASCEDYVRRKSGVTSFDAHATLEELERDYRERAAPKRRAFFHWRSSGS